MLDEMARDFDWYKDKQLLQETTKEHITVHYFKSKEVTIIDLVIYDFYKLIEAH